MQNFTHRVNRLEQEINDISLNINKVKTKSHLTMSSIVEKLKLLSENTQTIANNIDNPTIDLINEQQKENFTKLYINNNSNSTSNLYNYNDIHDYNIDQKKSNHRSAILSKRISKSINHKKMRKSNLEINDDISNDISVKNYYKFKLLEYSNDNIEDINYVSKIKNNTFNKPNANFDNDDLSNSIKYSNYLFNKDYMSVLKENCKHFQTKSDFNTNYMEKETLMNDDSENNDIKFYSNIKNKINRNQDKNINIVKPKIFKYKKKIIEIPNTNDKYNNYDYNKNNNTSYSEITNKNNIEDDKNNTNDANEINQILKIMDVQNINEAIFKLKQLKKRYEFYQKIKSIYSQNGINNNNNSIISTENECEKILSWIKNINNENKEIECYENLCKNIMCNNNIKNFNQLKIFLNEVLVSMGKNEKLIERMKKICQNEFVVESINGKKTDSLKNISESQVDSDI